MNRKHNHPGLYLVKYVGEFEVFVPSVDIAQAVTDLYLAGLFQVRLFQGFTIVPSLLFCSCFPP